MAGKKAGKKGLSLRTDLFKFKNLKTMANSMNKDELEKVKGELESVLIEWETGSAGKNLFDLKGKERIERWTIDRNDEEAGVVRIERVSMHDQQFREMSAEDLFNQAGAVNEDLGWWDLESSSTHVIQNSQVQRFLQIKEHEKLSENMVFWLYFSESDSLPVYIAHATRSARMLSSDLYKKVLRKEQELEEEGHGEK